MEPVGEEFCRSGSQGNFTVEVMSDLRPEGDAGNNQAQGTGTEALRWDVPGRKPVRLVWREIRAGR